MPLEPRRNLLCGLTEQRCLDAANQLWRKLITLGPREQIGKSCRCVNLDFDGEPRKLLIGDAEKILPGPEWAFCSILSDDRAKCFGESTVPRYDEQSRLSLAGFSGNQLMLLAGQVAKRCREPNK
jgi:hypothetical protein